MTAGAAIPHGPVGWTVILLLGAALLVGFRRAIFKWPDWPLSWRVGACAAGSLGFWSWLAAWPYAISGVLPWHAFLGRVGAVLLVLGWTFAGMLALTRLALNPRWKPLAVARTVLSEAISTRIVVGLIGLTFFAQAALVFMIGESDAPLRYRVQDYLTYGLSATFFILCVMTVILSCWTISNEVSRHQIFTVAVKPIGRGSYLIGKWIGVVLLNAMLVTLSGAVVYGLTTFYLAKLDPMDRYDAAALPREVLTSRIAMAPMEPPEIDKVTQDRYEKELRENPETILRMGGPEAARFQIRQRALMQWRAIAPMNGRRFVFEGIGAEARRGDTIQLRYKINLTQPVPDDLLPAMIRVNRQELRIKMIATKAQVVALPSSLIGEDGRLELEIVNINPWEPRKTYDRTILVQADGLELLFPVGGFGANFVRAMLVMWLKLAFLSMLGLTCGAFLSFPVAAMSAFTVFVGAYISPFVLDSLTAFTARTEGAQWLLFALIQWMAGFIATALSRFSDYAAIPQVVDGRLFPWSDVLSCALWVGVLWTGLAGVIGWLIFRSRELARVQV